MKCLSCGADVPEGSKFCAQCGRAIGLACLACHYPHDPGAKFCAQCGAKLPERLDEPARPVVANKLPVAERRQVTVVFCDLVDSTVLSGRLDPEDLRAVIAAYQRCCSKVIRDHGGFVAKYLGDGILAYFGYPRAYEDACERAVRAGLAVIQAVGKLQVAGEPLEARVGIATGLVVVGDLIGEGAAQEQAVVGETPNLAARLQTLAEPGSVVIGASTRRLLGALFDYRDLGAVALKGFAEPVAAFEVLRPSAMESRFEARQERGIVPLVDREEELELLQRRWRQAQAGEGRVVLLTGEPGIGKSRIVQALQDELAKEPHVRLHYFCSPHHQDSTLYPAITQLGRAAGFARDDTQDVKLLKLETLLSQSNATAEEVGLIAGLLSIPTGERYQLAAMSLQRRKEKTFEALQAQLAGLAAQQPVLMIFEDVQWIDPTSLELMSLSVEQVKRLPVLLLITARPEFKPPWPNESHVTALAPTRLGRADAAALVDCVVGGKALPTRVVEQILARTDGVPLFVEELTKVVMESDAIRETDGRYALTGTLPSLAIPTTLHDSLMARLDRLAPARDVVQIGAALGREFSYDLLRAAAAMPDDRLQEALDDLVRSELVFRRGVPPEATYTFKHALVQDAAYQSMLKSRRIQLHARIADVLEASFPGLAQTEPETLARHYTAAALPERAIHYWLAAGQRARQRSAHKEAIRHFSAGITLLPDLPDQTTRMRLEVDLQAALGFTLVVAKGYAAPEVEAAFSRAYELNQTIGETLLAIPVLRGLTTFHWVRGNLPIAKRFGLQLAKIAERTSDDELSSVLHGMLGGILYYMGEIAQSETWFSKLRAAYDHQERRNIIMRFGEDTPSTTWCFHGFNLAWLGYLDMASAAVGDAVASARRAEHPYSVANALCRAAVCHVILRNAARAASYAGQCVAIARDLGFPIPLAMATIVLGWASVLDGKTREGLDQIHDGVAQWRSTGARIVLPFYCALLSEAMLAGGDIGAALASADEGRRLSMENSEHAWDCLVHCSHGDALFASGEVAEAEADYQKALAWSRERSVKWAELFAALRLARLWRFDGRTERARELLTPIYDWFTDGFDNAVLKDAKALLDETPSPRS
jgi:class 3 adenylate cyclase/tetratricopeptide (TPR) repeat protein